MMELKKRLFEHCLELVNDRILRAESAMRGVQEAANEETKSSAGDKYETGRAMMHLEKEKLAEQLAEALKMKQALDSIQIDKTSDSAELGSLVLTENANYFLSVSAGVVEMDNEMFFLVSPASPIGQLMLGRKAGEHYSFRGKSIDIKSVH